MKQVIKKYEQKFIQIQNIERQLRLSNFSSPKVPFQTIRKYSSMKSELPNIVKQNKKKREDLFKPYTIDNRSFYMGRQHSNRYNNHAIQKQRSALTNILKDEHFGQILMDETAKKLKNGNLQYFLIPSRPKTDNECQMNSYQSEIFIKPQKATILERSHMFQRKNYIPNHINKRMCIQNQHNQTQKQITIKNRIRQRLKQRKKTVQPIQISHQTSQQSKQQKLGSGEGYFCKKIIEQNICNKYLEYENENKLKKMISPWILQEKDEGREIWDITKR